MSTDLIPLQILSRDEVDQIHVRSLEVLEETGVEVREEAALSVLADAGCKVDFKSRRARFPAPVMERLIRQVPSQFTWYARDPRHNIILGNGTVHFGTTFGSSMILDLAGVRRPATYQDAERATTLIDRHLVRLVWRGPGSIGHALESSISRDDGQRRSDAGQRGERPSLC